jgi:curli biogenesis system outer membrane secretion channel CsgG
MVRMRSAKQRSGRSLSTIVLIALLASALPGCATRQAAPVQTATCPKVEIPERLLQPATNDSETQVMKLEERLVRLKALLPPSDLPP